MAKDTNTTEQILSVAIEIGSRSFYAVVCKVQQDREFVETTYMGWRHEATTLNSSLGLEELSEALSDFVRREDLFGQDIHIVLCGEFCVTRYVTGTQQAVEDRLIELDTRAQRYLLLGQGRKITARHVQETENGDYYGLATVANIHTLQTISAAAKAAGVRPISISASTVLLAGVVHQTASGSGTGMVLRPRGGGADLAIVDNGRLLLDVRPALKMNEDKLSEYVSDRVALLERFFQRNAVGGHRDLNRVFVFGDEHTIAPLTQQLSCHGILVEGMNQTFRNMKWAPAETIYFHKYTAAIGAAFGALSGTQPIQRPNLLDMMNQTGGDSIRRHLVKTLWPIAAAIILCIGLLTMTSAEHKRTLAVRDVLIEFEDFEIKHWDLQNEVDVLQQEVRHLTTIGSQLKPPAYNKLITVIAGCLSNESQLESISVDQQGLLRIHGSTASEDAVYEFVENVNQQPAFDKAALSGTRSESSQANPRIQFDVDAQIRIKQASSTTETPRA